MGSAHTCALTSAGGVQCWGSNYRGQLGNGIATDSPIPVDVIGLSGPVSAISANDSHTCALTSAGGVQCWGDNYSGEGGSTNSGSINTNPVDVIGLSGPVSAISAGGSHTCALMSAGGIQCWGNNVNGQLGNNSTIGSPIPVDVVGLSGPVSAISAGGSHTCALTSEGGVQCWGRGLNGELGNGNTISSPTPVNVMGLSGPVSAIAASSVHSCALMRTGGVQCWGQNGSGQLGNASAAGSPIPVDVVGLSGPVSAISVGGSHTCALTSASGVQCWGNNDSGQLGNDRTTSALIPLDVIGLSGSVSVIAAGGSHTCARMSARGIQCWGSNSAGQLGNNNKSSSPTPVDVIGLSGPVSAISAGGSHTCALASAGGVQCWGANYYGQLGNGRTISSPVPVDVTGLGGPVSAIAAGQWHACALLSAGGVQCWGWNLYGQGGSNNVGSSNPLPMGVTGLGGPVSAIAAGLWHTCALTRAGGVQCWGYNYSGQLGNNSTNTSAIPVDVIGLSGPVRAIAAGRAHTCALTSAGSIQCWGASIPVRLPSYDRNSIEDSATAVDVIGLSGPVSAVSAGGGYTCALMSAGGAQCWGPMPRDVTGFSGPVSAITIGEGHFCALMTAGDAQCWGRIGLGYSYSPVDVVGLKP